MLKFKSGFTLIEVMIVVAIIGILAAIATTQYQNLIINSKEATTKGNLGTLRSALTIYYGDNEEGYPTDVADLVSLTAGGKYIATIPRIELPTTPNSPGHPVSNAVVTTAITDVGGFYYYNAGMADPMWGRVIVNCLHQDIRGTPWSAD